MSLTADPRLKRVNFYVDPEDVRRVADAMGCRPSEAVRRLIDNYLLAIEIDEVRRMPGPAPEAVFRRGSDYALPPISEDEDVSEEAFAKREAEETLAGDNAESTR